MKRWPGKRKLRARPGLNQPKRKKYWSTRMMRKLKRMSLPMVCVVAMTVAAQIASAQQGVFTPEDVIKYTPDWHGERSSDGRPNVQDEILDRMGRVTLDEA